MSEVINLFNSLDSAHQYAAVQEMSIDDIKGFTKHLHLTHGNMVALIEMAEQFANNFNKSGNFTEAAYDLCDLLADALIVADKVYAVPKESA